MTAIILPDAADIAADPKQAAVLEQVRREMNEHVEYKEGPRVEFQDHAERLSTREAKVIDEPVAKAKPKQKPAPDAYDGADVPELKGKTSGQIAREYLDLQRTIGSQGRDLGDARKHLAALTPRAAPQARAEKTDPASDVEFFASPRESIAKAVASSLQPLRAHIEQTRNTKASETLAKEFPDFQSTLSDQAFRDYVGASKVRMALLRQAHENYDMDSARELFGTWAQLTKVRK
jgi:hypothetical protein